MKDGNLCVLITADASGADWRYSVDLAAGLARLGIETIIALVGPSPSTAQREVALRVPGLLLVDNGLASDRMADDPAATRSMGAAISRIADENGADVVHLNMPALASDAIFRMPVVVTHHRCAATWWQAVHGTVLPPELARRTDMVCEGLHTADVVVTPTAAFGAVTQAFYRLPEAPKTVHIGRSRLNFATQPTHDFVFTAGRLWDEAKNIDTLDAAAGRIGVPVHAAGPLAGPDGAVMFDNINCVGALEDGELARWLSARPVFVSTALYEPFGLAVLEAASAGCPLILSDIPSFRELWEDVATFVPPLDEATFTRAIGDMVNDDFERAVMGRAAQERAALFTPDAMAAQMASIYRSLLPAIRRPVLAASMAA